MNQTQTEESWKTISEADGYEISNYGNIRVFKKDKYVQLNPYLNKYKNKILGCRIKIGGIHEYVHRLVGKNFIENEYPERTFIDHIDGDVTNNHHTNLRWCDRRQNSLNSKKSSNNTSGYKGVARCNSYWEAAIICPDGKRIRKQYKNLEDAIAFRRELVETYYDMDFFIHDR